MRINIPLKCLFKTIVILVFAPAMCLAQDSVSYKTKSNHRFLIRASSYTSIGNPKADLYRWVDPVVTKSTDFLTISNRYSYQLGVQYEYLTNRGVTFSSSLLYGAMRYQYNWDFTFDYFDDFINVNSYNFNFVHKKHLPYLSAMLNVGYRLALPHSKFCLNGNIGASYLRFLKTENSGDTHYLLYNRNDTLFSQAFAYTEYVSRKHLFNYTLYLGGIYVVNSKFVKEYRLGVEFTNPLSFARQAKNWAMFVYGQYYDSNGKVVTSDLQYNRFRNIALNLSIGF